MIVTVPFVITGILGLVYQSTAYYSLSCTFALASFVCCIIASVEVATMGSDRVCVVMGILILLIEFVNMIVLLSLTVILIYQIYVKKESSRANLDMKDPDAMIDTNLLRGMLHLIPGLGLFSHKIAEWTKEIGRASCRERV